jgi:membrane associated rhomboid family serine protease
MATCYRHPTRQTGVSCSSCGRPICPDCMTTTPVGMRCPECSRQRTRVVRMREMAAEPRVTYALIAVNFILFLAEGRLSLSSGGVLGGSLYDKGALLGSIEGPQFAGQGVAHGQWWRLLSSGFLHENFLHVGMNMLVLYLLGRMIEPALGSLKFAVIYFVSLLAGSFGALLLSPHTFTVGASGAIFGIAGAAAVEMRARQIPIMQSGIGGLILINLAFSFAIPGISIGGHIGGLIGGALAALALQLGERRRSQALGYAACAAIAVASVAGGLATAKASDVSQAPGESLLLAPPQ